MDISEKLKQVAKEYATEGDEISGYFVIKEEADAFVAGAEWMQKEISLTWQDVRKLCSLSFAVEVYLGREVSDAEHYGEVLRRFRNGR